MLDVSKPSGMKALMEKPKGWNFSAFYSVADPFDALVGRHGDKATLGTLACLLVLALEPDQRRELIRMLGHARADVDADGGDLYAEVRKRWTTIKVGQLPPADKQKDLTPPAGAEGRPSKAHDITEKGAQVMGGKKQERKAG